MLKTLIAVLFVLSFVLAENPVNAASNDKPVIILAAFGTSVARAQKSLENIDAEVCKAFPGHDVRWAFTSQFIIKKLRKQGINTIFSRKVPLKQLEEVYADLNKEGIKNAVVQSLHVVEGQEYNEVLTTPTNGLTVKYGKPLLTDDKSIDDLGKYLEGDFGGNGCATILCGHGNDHHSKYNVSMVKLDKFLRSNYKNVFVATVEGQPGCEKALEEVKKSGLKNVRFVPTMIVAGDHIMNDVMGDEEDSWKTILGLKATCAKPLGFNSKVIGVFLNSLKAAMNS